MISMDRNIFDEQSSVGARMVFLAHVVDELHIIVTSLESDMLEALQLEDNVFVYPTNSKSRWHYFRDVVRIGKELTDIDLVTAQDPAELGWMALRLGTFHTAPVELQVHTDIFSTRFRRSSLLNRFRMNLAKHNLRRADTIRVVSDRIKRSVLLHAGQRYRSIPVRILPVFIDNPHPANADQSAQIRKIYEQFDFIILMVARLVAEKNIEGALDAFARVVAEHPRAGLVVLGDGPLLSSLQQKTTTLGIEDNVCFEGWKAHSMQYMRASDALLLTSEYEGYGRTLIEAALVGCPVVTTDVGIAGDILHDDQDALVCPVGDMDCIAQELTRLIEDTSLRDVIRESAKRAAEDHIVTGEQYLAILKDIWESCVS